MKKLILAILILIPVLGHAQGYEQGYKYIRKAERIIDRNGNLDRALKYLDKAKGCDYGFCGNAWASAFWDIRFLAARVYQEQGKYRQALGELDSILGCTFGANCHASDSLKIAILAGMYGKSRLLAVFESAPDPVFLRKDSIFQTYTACLAFDSVQYDLCIYVGGFFNPARELEGTSFIELLRAMHLDAILKE